MAQGGGVPGAGGNPSESDSGGAPAPEDAGIVADRTVPLDAVVNTPGLDPAILTIVAAVDTARVSATINKLASYTTRNTCSNDTSSGNTIGAARDWIKAQYQAIPGLNVSLDDFTYTGCAAGAVTDQTVVAVKLGAHPDRVIVIGGHYDSRTLVATDPTSPSPGANDSGSQSAALLEAARVMAGLQFDATLMFASFAGEEVGLRGSAQLVKDYPKFVTPGAKVEAMFDLDIVGGDNVANDAAALQQFRVYSSGTPREFNTPMGVTDDESPQRGLMRYIGYWGDKYVPSMTMIPELREDRPGRGSDQESFINAGYPAVRVIETNESPNAATLASHQHSPNDLPMYVTPAYTARIAEVVISVAASLARAPTPPQMAHAMGNATGPVAVTWSEPASGPSVDHYVIAARPVTENFYHTRVTVPKGSLSHSVTASDLGLAGGAFYISVAAVDAGGHESLFAYPEYRCDTTSCVVPPDSLDVTARN
jgi:acetylornithine deacetylase/succinyl-diaminopimelate desuccinylase-like protein